MCSTPFGITDYIGGGHLLGQPLTHAECSTPFGITDYIGFGRTFRQPCSQRCSTPFGITDYIGGARRGHRHHVSGAQRLSASRIISDGDGSAAISRRFQCSTPFGITDYIGTTRYLRLPKIVSVLNAFRHHGLYRRLLVGAIVIVDRIDVLNAFRHHGLYRQRRRVIVGQLTECSTPFGITDYIGGNITLTGLAGEMCSTPFGITDYIGRGTKGAPVYGRQCSTPFGITDYIGPSG